MSASAVTATVKVAKTGEWSDESMPSLTAQ